MQFTRITIFHIIWLVSVPTCTYFAASFGKHHFGVIAAIGIGFAVFVVCHFAWCIWMTRLHSGHMKRIAAMSNEQLWDTVHKPSWDLTQTFALLQLGARGDNVLAEFPRIRSMLISDRALDRVYGWDAMLLIFDAEAAKVIGYDPRESVDACRRKAGILFEGVDTSGTSSPATSP